MSKKKKKSDGYYSGGSSFISDRHGPKEHALLPLWNGTAQATNASDLRNNFKDYDLCVFLTDMTIPEEVPFCLGVNPPQTKNRLIIYAIGDQHAPDNDYFFEWMINTVRKELQDGKKIGVACIGGHGRTGTFLSVLWGLANAVNGVPPSNPIVAIRKIIGCEKEVESMEQEEFVYEYTGFPRPEKLLYQAKSYKWSSGAWGGNFGYATDPGTWHDRYGKVVSPVKLEPSLYEGELVVPGGSVFIKRPFIITKAWAIPLRCDKETGKVPPNNRMPAELCKVCDCALGYLLPLNKDSIETCTVCPILVQMGVTRGVYTTPKSTTTLNGDELCDTCGFKLDPVKSTTMFINGDPYQFCDEECKVKYFKKVKDPKALSATSKDSMDTGVKTTAKSSTPVQLIHNKVKQLMDKYNGKVSAKDVN